MLATVLKTKPPLRRGEYQMMLFIIVKDFQVFGLNV